MRDLVFLYNEEKRYHEEYQGFDDDLINGKSSEPLKNDKTYFRDDSLLDNLDRGVKQADVVLLGFPLLWGMPDDVRLNDLTLYEPITDTNGPAMTWGIFAIK